MKNFKKFYILLCLFLIFISSIFAQPQPITNLSALTGDNESEIFLEWTYPGPDLLPSGSLYEIQKSTCEDIFWSTGTINNICISTGPVFPSDNQTYIITGLIASSTYFFRIWISSGSSLTLWSPVSNGATTWANIISPGPITNLSGLKGESAGTVDLSWTVPGDDNYINVITTGAYRLKYSTYPEYSFSVSDYNVEISTYNQNPGIYNYYNITGLTEGVTYYFRIWTRDENLFNWSPISNGATTWANRVEPGVITTLSGLTGYYEGEILLSWISPGNNGYTGDVLEGKWQIKYTTDQLKSYNEAENLLELTTSFSPGILHKTLLTGLQKNNTYYIWIKSRDDYYNWSDISNKTTALAQIDVSPPKQIEIIRSTEVGFRHVVLNWVATVEDDNLQPYNTGMYTGTYEIKYSSCLISSDDLWNRATTFAIINKNILPGSTESIVITGLTNNILYYFSIKTKDETGNISVYSSSSPFFRPYNTPPENFSVNIPTITPSGKYTSVFSNRIIVSTDVINFSWSKPKCGSNDELYGDFISSYTFIFYPFKGGSSTTISGIFTTTFTYIFGSSCENTTFYWYVNAFDIESLTSISQPFGVVNGPTVSINTKNEPPTTFYLYITSGIYHSQRPYGEETSSPYIILKWQNSYDYEPGDFVNSYSVFYSSYNDFSFKNSINNIKVTSCCLTYSQLQENTTFWWYVVAYDSGGLLGYSQLATTDTYFMSGNTWYFVVNGENSPPNIFDLLSPLNNTIVYKSTPILSWQQATDPDPGDSIRGYKVFISSFYPPSNENYFPSGLEYITNTSTVSPFLIENTTYWWYVKAFDWNPIVPEPEFSPGSTVTFTLSFIVNAQSEPPKQFDLISPVGTLNPLSLKLTFYWNQTIDPDPYDYVDHYIFYYSTKNTFDIGITTFIYTSNTTYYLPVDLLVGVSYYWNVMSYGNNEPAEIYRISNSTFIFYIENRSPEKFYLYKPSTTISTFYPDFDWSDSTDLDNYDSVKYYELYYSTSSNFETNITTTIGPLYVSSHSITHQIQIKKPYYWNVRAYDNYGNYNVGFNTFSFILGNFVPENFDLIYPLNNIILSTDTPVVMWQNRGDRNLDLLNYTVIISSDSFFRYKIQISTSQDSWTQTNWSTVSIKTPSLLENITYYWYVIVFDGIEYNVSVSTGQFRINAKNEPPTKFDLTAPYNKEIIKTQKPQLQWQISYDFDPDDSIDHYEIYYSTDNFMSFYMDVSQTNNYQFTKNLIENYTYKWFVICFDKTGLSTVSDSTYTFIVDSINNLPDEFNLIEPQNNTIISTSNPVFIWEKANKTEFWEQHTYNLYLFGYIADRPQQILFCSDISTTSYTLNFNLSENVTYWWYVEAVDTGNQKKISKTTYYFYIDITNQAPEPVVLKTPENNKVLNSRKPIFEWYPTKDPDGKINNYILEYSTSDDFNISITTEIIFGNTTYIFALNTMLKMNTTYYWRICAVDDRQGKTFSEFWKFYVPEFFPNQVNLIEPVNNSVVNNRKPNFVWSEATHNEPSTKIDKYIFEYSTSEIFLAIFSTETKNTYYTIQNNLLQNLTYYWRIKVIDEFLNSVYSQTYKFYVPLIDKLKPPEIISVDKYGYEFKFSWSEVNEYEDGQKADDLKGYNIYKSSISPETGYFFYGFVPKEQKIFFTQVYDRSYFIVKAVNLTDKESSSSKVLVSDSSVLTKSQDENVNLFISSTVWSKLIETFENKKTINIIKQQIPDTYEIKVIEENTGKKIDNYVFVQPVKIVFKVSKENLKYTKLSSVSNYGIFYFNGIEYVYIGGEFNSNDNTVSVFTNKTGIYKLKSFSIESDFEITSIEPKKIFTPNKDGVYDEIKFRYINNTANQVTGEIYDVEGKFVNNMEIKYDQGEYLSWDGKDNSGNFTKKGIYIYQIKCGSKIKTGTIILVR